MQGDLLEEAVKFAKSVMGKPVQPRRLSDQPVKGADRLVQVFDGKCVDGKCVNGKYVDGKCVNGKCVELDCSKCNSRSVTECMKHNKHLCRQSQSNRVDKF